MRGVCAWCSAVLTAGEEPTTHGICSACAAEVFGTPAGVRREVALDEASEQKARRARAGVTQ